MSSFYKRFIIMHVWMTASVCLCREQKDPVYLRDKVSQKHSKEQFEIAQKIEQEYSKFFTGLLFLSASVQICLKMWHHVVKQMYLFILTKYDHITNLIK